MTQLILCRMAVDRELQLFTEPLVQMIPVNWLSTETLRLSMDSIDIGLLHV